jgi:hypothetical protein
MRECNDCARAPAQRAQHLAFQQNDRKGFAGAPAKIVNSNF